MRGHNVKNNKTYPDYAIKPQKTREELDAEIKAYLARGGKINPVPSGVTTPSPITIIRVKKGEQ